MIALTTNTISRLTSKTRTKNSRSSTPSCKPTFHYQTHAFRHHHNQYMTTQDKEEVIRENEKNFVEAYGSVTGPIKYMSAKDIEQVHLLIDEKMQELEESGLTREEILFNDQRGIPLADDPFF